MTDPFDPKLLYVKPSRAGNQRLRRTIRQVQRHCLTNGMTVITLEDHSLPIVTTMLWYRTGSRHEEAGMRGISHFLEHMMFKGTERFGPGEIDLITTRLGGLNNAFTSKDYTAYFFSFASDRWQVSLEIEADRMQNLCIEAADFEIEKQVVLEELKMELDSPWGRLRQAVDLESFESHSYRYPVIGFAEEVNGLRREHLVDFYRRFYLPSNSILVVAGDFQTEATLAHVASLFGSIPDKPVAPIVESGETIPKKGHDLVLESQGHVTRMLVSLPFPSLRRPEFYQAQMLETVLGEGKLCRLFAALVEKEQVSFLDTEINETFDPYRLIIRLELNEGIHPHTVRRRLFEELDALCQEPVSQEELARAGNQMVNSFLSNMETTFEQACQLGIAEALDRYERLADCLEAVQQVTPQDLLATAQQYCLPQLAVVGTIRKEGAVTLEAD